MRRILPAPLLLVLLALALLVVQVRAATVTVYTTLPSFLAAAPQAVVATDLESVPAGAKTSPFTTGGVTFSSSLNNLYVITPAVPGTTSPLPTSHMMSANGEEDFYLTPTGSWPMYSFGFTLLTNAYSGHTLTLYDAGGTIFYTYHPTQAHNTIGFVGFVSDTPIAKAHWVAASGQLQNTALDDIYFDTDPATPALNGTWGRLKSLYR